MPIYAYRCESCGHRQDVLQKMSDPLLTECPACAQPTFVKQVTAAGFQLKGSGWYVTDFRGGSTASGAAEAPGAAAAPAAAAPSPAPSPSAAPASASAPAPAPAAAPAAPAGGHS